LALATAIASVIPFVGTLLVWAPLVLYYIIIGVWWKAIFMLLWGMIVIGLVDNVMRPWLMKGRTNIHPMILFFGILGGIMTFNFWGIIYGPLIISIGLTLLHIYSLEYSSMIDENKFIWSKKTGKGIDISGKKKVVKKAKVVEKKRGRGRPRKVAK
jgi:predicted PurR-regulated permease PerM